jgi:transcription elongation factor/antiterminator RfaH
MSTAYGDTLSWYVVHTNPQQEDRANINLMAWQIETLNPKLRVKKYNQFSGKATLVSKALFPSYIFARFKLNEQYSRVRFTRGVHSLVSFNDTPASVDDEVIELVRARLGDDGFVNMYEELKAGDEVIINEGRFQNFCGVFEREIEDTDRVRILLSTVSFQAHVVVDRAVVHKASTERRAVV